MKKLLSSLISVAALVAYFAPCAMRAADTVDNAQINQLTPNGDWVPTQINFNSNSVGQEIQVLSTGALGLNPVTKGNLSSSVIASGSAVTLSTATPKTVTSITLGVGTWQVYGYVDYIAAAATTTLFQQGTATTTNSFTNSLQSQDTATADWNPMTTTSVTLTKAIPFLQFTVTSGTQTVYLIGQATFSAGGVTAYGSLFYKQIK